MAGSTPSVSPFWLRIHRFRRIKRGYWSFLVLAAAYLGSFLLPFLVHNRALVVRHDGNYYFPSARAYFYDTFGWGSDAPLQGSQFAQLEPDGRPRLGEADYRRLQETFLEAGGDDFVWLPLVPYSPYESLLDLPGNPPHQPMSGHWLGTDGSGRDVLARLAYGFRISISFALLAAFVAYSLGITVGAVLGYFGRWTDILGQRIVEIWGAVPFLYTVIIISSLFRPSFLLLVVIVSAFGWMGISYYIRGEFYREKSKDYVAAAIASGEGHAAIMLRHILPNALTPVITFLPFAIVAEIVALVSLDFLGFGLQAPAPSWGEMLNQARASQLREWHLSVFPLLAMFLTLQLIVFIGEAIREAFDPKVHSRLR